MKPGWILQTLAFYTSCHPIDSFSVCKNNRKLDKPQLRIFHQEIVTEVAFITTAFVICVSKCLCIAHPAKDFQFKDVWVNNAAGKPRLVKVPMRSNDGSIMSYEVSESCICEAAFLLFDDRKLRRKKIND